MSGAGITRVIPGTFLVALAIFAATVSFADEDELDEDEQDTRPGIAPDIRDDDTNLKLQRGNFVVVPIPISNPTFGDGLVGGAAYYYPQTAEEEERQPASVTAAAGMYTSNDSKAAVLVQQNYWRDNRWRFTGAVGAADLRLGLLAPNGTSSGSRINWRINGSFLFAKIARRLGGHWYGGLQTRLIDARQSIEIPAAPPIFDLGSDVVSAGMGLIFEYDSRDLPMNSYSGRHFKLDTLFNDERIGSDATYQSYNAALSSYHRLTDTVVLAWELQGCQRAGGAPLWDACIIKLRGFSATDYLGKVSASGQVEARWQLSPRWGLVGFGGAGYVSNSFSRVREYESIPSYGLGVRFSVLPAKRINLRLDYARSTNSSAIHLSVGEAF